MPEKDKNKAQTPNYRYAEEHEEDLSDEEDLSHQISGI